MKARPQIRLFSANRPIYLVLIFLLLSTASVMADCTLNWYTIDAGGGSCSGGRYTMVATIGQPEPQVNMGEVVVMSGGPFVFSGGYWPGSTGCVVNLDDLIIFVEQWLSDDPYATADFDGSGHVDLADFWELSCWWLRACPVGWPLK